MPQEIDALLAKFDLDHPTVRLCDALFSVAPLAPTPVPRRSLDEVAANVPDTDRAEVIRRARQWLETEDAQSALRVLQGLDQGPDVVTIFSSIKSAIALYMAHRDVGRVEEQLETLQARDAVLKAM